MPTCKWYLPTLAEVMQIAEPTDPRTISVEQENYLLPQASISSRAQREWYSAIASLNVLLERLLENTSALALDELPSPVEGIVISGPLPVLGRIGLIRRFSSWVLTGEMGQPHMPHPVQLLPAADIAASAELSTVSLPLLPDDPLGAEPFCLVLTSEFSLIMSLNVAFDESDNSPEHEQFMFSFTPEVVWQGWRTLRSRLELTTPQVISKLDSLVEQFAPITPDYRLVADFNRLMLAHFSDVTIVNRPTVRTSVMVEALQPTINFPPQGKEASASILKNNSEERNSDVLSQSAHVRKNDISLEQIDEGSYTNPKGTSGAFKQARDIELLQAIAHEVRTPLATIRTLTRLLLKQKSLPSIVLHRLEMIDAECTRQIDRFSLIFHAVELQEKPANKGTRAFAKTSLIRVLQQNMPQWQQQAEQRNLKLDALLPKTLPMVSSDPRMLEQVLSGLMDQLTHALPSGSNIELRAMPAGSQIKIQFFSNSPTEVDSSYEASLKNKQRLGKKNESIFSSTLKSIGQLLMLQPETGNLSLNLAVTKNLFHALGGKFTIRQNPHQGEVLTIFLPLDRTDI